jgi:hypothetical protein
VTQQELQPIIAQLQQRSNAANASFGIYQYGGGADESFIRANPEGLREMAITLLKAAAEMAEQDHAEEKKTIPFPHDAGWIDENGDTFIQYIEPSGNKPVAPLDEKESLKDSAFKYGCIAFFILLVVACIVGLFTLISWVF